MYAAYNNHASCVKVLLESGADLTLHNEDCLTAVELAVGQGHKAGKYWVDIVLYATIDMCQTFSCIP